MKPFGAADGAAMAAIARRARAEPATAIYVTVDDMLAADHALGPERPAVGTAAQLSDAELLTLAVLQALLRSYTTEARFLRYANEQLKALFPYLPKRPRLQQAGPGARHR